tara:strand:+ start:190 stop:384 length:195 start_codon:yes stop_codon:yes gene_type:complete
MGIGFGIYFILGLVIVSLIDLSEYLYPDATDESIDNWDRFINLILWPMVIFIFIRALIRKFLGE